MNQGFDRFYGLNCQRQSHNFYPTHVWSDRKKVMLDRKHYSHSLIADECLKFIRVNKDNPFFCYVPFTIPHAAMQSTEERIAPWRKKFPEFEKMTGKYGGSVITNPVAAFAAMMAEDVDAFVNFPAPENLPQFEADPRFQVIVGSTEGETILSTNNKMPPLDNVKVRKAIAHAIDRQAIIDGAMFGVGTPIGTHFAPHHPDYLDLTGNSAYDPDLAKQLLAEAGFENGFETTLKLPPPSYARRGGEIIAAQLRAVGIQTEISNLEWAQWLEQVFRGKDYGLTIVSHTEPMDIGIYARPDYYFQYDNPAFQTLMTDLRSESDPATRSAMLQKAQTIISEDYVNGFLFELAVPTVANAKIRGLWENAPTQATDLTGVSWSN